MSSLSPSQKAASGAIASVAANTIVYPLDLVKTIIQTQDKNESHYKNTLDCLQKLYRTKGLRSWYSGIGSSLIGTAAQNFYYFYWYSVFRKVYLKIPGKSGKDKKIFDELALGILAACVTQVFITPINVITTKEQTTEKGDFADEAEQEAKATEASDGSVQSLKQKLTSIASRNSMVKTAIQISEKEGVAKLWNGLTVSLILSINPSITYGSYERLRSLFFKDKEFLNPAESFGLGLLSKIIATLITQPLIVSKANLQKSNKYKNFQTAILTIYAQEGIRGLWKGVAPQITKASLVQGFLFMFKEQFDVFLLYLLKFLIKRRSKTALTV